MRILSTRKEGADDVLTQGREAAEAEKAKQRRAKRSDSIEQWRRQKYSKLIGEENANKGIQS